MQTVETLSPSLLFVLIKLFWHVLV